MYIIIIINIFSYIISIYDLTRQYMMFMHRMDPVEYLYLLAELVASAD